MASIPAEGEILSNSIHSNDVYYFAYLEEFVLKIS